MRMFWTWAALLLLALAAATSACVTIPRATVRLSEIEGEQIAQMQVSHEKFVRMYYGRLRAEVDHFLTERWIPTFLAKATGDPDFRRDLDAAYKTANLRPDVIQLNPRAGGELPEDLKAVLLKAIELAIDRERARLGTVMLDFAQAALKEIHAQRAEMIGPIDEQETMVIDSLQEGYADLQRARGAIHGLLASAIQLQEERDVILQKLGLLETQRKVIDAAVEAGDAAARGLEIAEKADAAIDGFKDALKKGREQINALRSEGP